MQSNIKYYPSVNFQITGNPVYLSDMAGYDPDTSIVDERNGIVSLNTNFDSMEWYLNYIEQTRQFAQANKNSRWQYLLNIGYIPLVYLPAPMLSDVLNQPMLEVLQRMRIPYITLRISSFVFKYLDIGAMDAWISKVDASKYFGLPIEQINSTELIRRIFVNG